MMLFNVFTLFPDTIECFSQESIIKKALERGIIKINVYNIRNYSANKHKSVDDYPFGGGSGMLMSPDPLFRAVESLGEKGRVIYLNPMGARLRQQRVRELSMEKCLTLLCGHYEGIDHRVVEHVVDEEISIGDYILTCGEIAAAILIDSVTRELEGVLGNRESKLEESFDKTGLLEYEQYTRPAEYRGHSIPEVLISGNHEEIKKWRMKRRLINTLKRRPDLFNHKTLSVEYKKLLSEVLEEIEL
jgi:tRNA (guanine37-N1)-methyltransferase